VKNQHIKKAEAPPPLPEDGMDDGLFSTFQSITKQLNQLGHKHKRDLPVQQVVAL
jgi:hypothetical protein